MLSFSFLIEVHILGSDQSLFCVPFHACSSFEVSPSFMGYEVLNYLQRLHFYFLALVSSSAMSLFNEYPYPYMTKPCYFQSMLIFLF